MDNSPIGIFDSGLGGLTVLKELLTQLPNESFIYLGDTARLPYGTKSPDTIRKYLLQTSKFLAEKKVKAIVVACNSASSVVKDSETYNDIPIYGVIKPGAQSAVSKTDNQRIGVIATTATINQDSYKNAIHKLAPEAKVHSKACPLLVPLVEEGWHEDPLTNLILHRYLSDLLGDGIDTLVLGCTHYPVLKTNIKKIVGPYISLVDSAEAIAFVLKEKLSSANLLSDSKKPYLKVFATDVNDSFPLMVQRVLGTDAKIPVEVVNL